MKNYVKVSDKLLAELFPINRSITGSGNRHSLKILKKIVPLKIKSFKSGQKVFDWKIPDEWNPIEAWIKDKSGNILIDFKVNNLHLLGYSTPIHKKFFFHELKENLFYDKKKPKSIPYRTSYYKKRWGFCVTKSQYDLLKKSTDKLEVCIKTNFKKKGEMNYGELLIPGKTRGEILISTYLCHPSMANDNLSGVILTALIAKEILRKKNLKKSYRIIWVPETIGAIAYCKNNEKKLNQIKYGLVISTVGGPGRFSFKKSWDEKHFINDLAEKILKENRIKYKNVPFDIHGSDERQFSSQAFRINTVTIAKSKYYDYAQYHSSADDLTFVKSEYILKSLKIYMCLIEEIENQKIYKSEKKYCEPMLSKYGLYPEVGGEINPNIGSHSTLDIILWLIFLCDGNTSLEQIEKKIKVDRFKIRQVIKILLKKKILSEI